MKYTLNPNECAQHIRRVCIDRTRRAFARIDDNNQQTNVDVPRAYDHKFATCDNRRILRIYYKRRINAYRFIVCDDYTIIALTNGDGSCASRALQQYVREHIRELLIRYDV